MSAYIGSAGFSFFNEILAKAEASRQIMSKGQKLQLAAVRRRSARHDLLGDWAPLVERVFEIWETASGVRAVQPAADQAAA